LINSLPMGFYAPAQIIRDAREHGVAVLPIDVNHSQWDCTLEPTSHRLSPDASDSLISLLPHAHEATKEAAPETWGIQGPAIRLGMRLVKGLRQEEAQRIAAAVTARRGSSLRAGFPSISALWRAADVRVATLKSLAEADAFNSMGLDRQQAHWQIRQLRDESLPLFDQLPEPTLAPEPAAPLPPLRPIQHVEQDYRYSQLSLRPHPLTFIRHKLNAMGAVPNAHLKDEAQWKHHTPVRVAGIVLVRQRPGTASGIVFITLEDETGIANLVVRPAVFEQYRKAARHGMVLLAQGKVERKEQVVHIMTHKLISLDHELKELTTSPRNFH